MSVALAYHNLEGCWLATDCRVKYDDGPVADDLQKVFAFWPHTAIAFVGRVSPASKLLGLCRSPEAPTLPAEVHGWIPRVFRRFYHDAGLTGDVNFIVATAYEDSPRMLDRAVLQRRLWTVATEDKKFSFPGWMTQLMDNGSAPILVPGAVRTDVCIIKSPHFKPEPVEPMTIRSVGSGAKVSDGMVAFEKRLLFTNKCLQVPAFRTDVESYIHQHHAEHIGGQLCLVRIGSRISIEAGERKNSRTGAEIGLSFEAGRIIQTNSRTGVRIQLRRPWETGPGGTFPLTELFA